MDNNLSISYEKVRSDANTIKDSAATMRNIFEDFGASMARVGAGDVFAGVASDSLGQRFASLKTKFDDYVKLVDMFANTVLSASSQTQSTEQAIASATENLAK